MKLGKYFSILLITESFCSFGQQMVRGDFTFYPDIVLKDQIHIEVEVMINDVVVDSKIITSFPANFTLNVSNESSKDVFFKIKVSNPDGYSTNEVPWKFNPRNRYIPLRSKVENYHLNKTNAQNEMEISNFEGAIYWYSQIIDNEFYSTSNQALEAYRGLANSYYEVGNVDKSIEVYEKVLNVVNFDVISPNRKLVFWQERLDKYMQIGEYNTLKNPIWDFPNKIVSEETAVTKGIWETFIKQYSENNDLTDPITNFNLELEDVQKQFSIIGQDLNRINF